MHIVFLRGAVPPKDEHPEKLRYKNIEQCEDVWTQLFYYYLKYSGNTGELLYQGGCKVKKVDESYTEKWVPSLKGYKPEAKPRMIICRGGFGYYDSFIERFPAAKKIYYGAGKRFYPTGFRKYDLILTDSPKQFSIIKGKGNIPSALFIKPAAKLFRPVPSEKIYDVCFMANASQVKIKRHDLLIRSLAGSGLKVLNLGNTDKKLIKLARDLGTDIEWGGWSLRRKLPERISQCRVGVCCSTSYDSCPRVIPEYLACGVPVVVTSNINFWAGQYINKDTGLIAGESEILDAIKMLIKMKPRPRQYYKNNLSVECAAKYLDGLIRSYILR